MTGLAIMLAAAIVPTAFPRESSPISAKCVLIIIRTGALKYWQDDYGFTISQLEGFMISMVFSEFILLGGLSIRLLEMSSVIRRLSKGSLRAVLGRLCRKPLIWVCGKLQQLSKPVQALFIPLVIFSLAFLVSIQAILDFLGPDICGVGDNLLYFIC